MPSATLNRFRTTCQSYGIPMSLVGQVCNVKPTSLSSALRDVMFFDPTLETRLLTVATRLGELRDAFEPARLPDDPAALGKLVEGLEDGRVSLDEIRGFVKCLMQ